MTPQQRPPHPAPPDPRPRLRLKPKDPETGYVDGAWWPRSNNLSGELPGLLAVLSIRLGPVLRVLYHFDDWDEAPATLTAGGRRVHLDGYRHQPAHTLTIQGANRSATVVLVVAPYTPADDAHALMMAAAGHDNLGATVEDLMAISLPRQPAGTDDGAAEQRWDSDGGALATPSDTTLAQRY